MPRIRIELTEAELTVLRTEAAESGMAVERLAHDVVVRGVALRRRLMGGGRVAGPGGEMLDG